MHRPVLLYVLVFLLGYLVGGNLHKSPETEVSNQPYPTTMGIMVTPPTLEELEELDIENGIPLVRVSAYNAVPRQTQGDPNVSSCGPNRPNQIAVSRDLFFDEQGRKHLCGKTATVVTDRGEKFKEYVIWDTMAPRFTQTADILLPTLDESEAYAFGIATGILVIHD